MKDCGNPILGENQLAIFNSEGSMKTAYNVKVKVVCSDGYQRVDFDVYKSIDCQLNETWTPIDSTCGIKEFIDSYTAVKF